MTYLCFTVISYRQSVMRTSPSQSQRHATPEIGTAHRRMSNIFLLKNTCSFSHACAKRFTHYSAAILDPLGVWIVYFVVCQRWRETRLGPLRQEPSDAHQLSPDPAPLGAWSPVTARMSDVRHVRWQGAERGDSQLLIPLGGWLSAPDAWSCLAPFTGHEMRQSRAKRETDGLM